MPRTALTARRVLRWLRHPGMPRRTVRLRLTMLYGGMFLACGAGLLFITYLLVAHRLPTYLTQRGTTSSGNTAVTFQTGGGGDC